MKFFIHPWTREQMKLLWYYVDDLGLTIEQADSVMHTAWVYGYMDKQIPIDRISLHPSIDSREFWRVL